MVNKEKNRQSLGDRRQREIGVAVEVNTNHLLEGLVNGPKPADVGARCEEDEPEKGEAKVGGSPASDQPRETAHQVHGQRDAVHCRPRSTCTHRDRHQIHTQTPKSIQRCEYPNMEAYAQDSI